MKQTIDDLGKIEAGWQRERASKKASIRSLPLKIERVLQEHHREVFEDDCVVFFVLCNR